jgi:predicted nucleotidyltransferase component of viral defense system
MNRPLKDVGASVRARLLQLAKQRGDDFQLLLTRYANERLLYRLTKSQHASLFLLKGAALFTVRTGHAHRATRDVDLLGFGKPSGERLRAIFSEVVARDVDDDGVRLRRHDYGGGTHRPSSVPTFRRSRYAR